VTTAAPVICIDGTWAKEPGHDDWARIGSPFTSSLVAAGLDLYHPEDPFSWDTALGGVLDDAPWERAGTALANYMRKYGGPASVLGHSHGGNVLPFAAAHGAKFEIAVSVATPVRDEMRVYYRILRQAATTWAHVYSDESVPGSTSWQALGELSLNPSTWKRVLFPVREFTLAYPCIYLPGHTHEELMEPDVWRRFTLFDLFKGELGKFDALSETSLA
jgi:hypothetical protein